MTAANSKISVVVPAYNEAAGIESFHARLTTVLQGLDLEWEVIYVNDGSTDNTLDLLRGLVSDSPRIRVIDLSRNYGKEIALTAGLDHVESDAAIPIDADLQDPPELIPELISRWKQGYDVVYATRRSRSGESWIKKSTAYFFYRLMQSVGDSSRIPMNTGDFRLMNRKALDAFCQMRERHRFLKGLFSIVGFKQCSVGYDRDPRHAGRTSWNYSRLIDLSIEGFTSFTTAPLRLATYLGLFVGFIAFVFVIVIIYKTLVYGDPVAGYPSLMSVVLFLGGIQLAALGIIGEYLGRIFNETKNRPLYFVQDVISYQEPG